MSDERRGGNRFEEAAKAATGILAAIFGVEDMLPKGAWDPPTKVDDESIPPEPPRPKEPHYPKKSRSTSRWCQERDEAGKLCLRERHDGPCIFPEDE